MALQLLPGILVVAALAAQMTPEGQRILSLQNRIADLKKVVGAQAPLLNSENDRKSAQVLFDKLTQDVESTIQALPKRTWLTQLRIQLRDIADNLDLQFQATDSTSVRDGNLYLKALSAIIPKQSDSKAEFLILDQGDTQFGLPENPMAFGFSIVSREDLARRFQASKTPIIVSIVHPAASEGHLIKVVVEHRVYTSRADEHVLSISDWSVAYFRLDQTSNLFYLLKVKTGGI